ncbi:MAG: Rieske 2Fe-2S domain-containing protein [Planctomycetota bacterium]
MTAKYVWVQWNRHKKVYDLLVVGAVVLSILGFVGVSAVLQPGTANEGAPTLVIRALGVTAIAMLHVILAIGPLARLDRRFAPLLYNRRHLGVTMFLVAFLHGFLSIGYYGGFGENNALSAVLGGYGWGGGVTGVPFEWLGFLALLVLFVMAATSHDFWLATLGHRAWKTLHMGVYVAYALLIAHVGFGALQGSVSAVYPALMGVGVVGLSALHVAAGVRENTRDARTQAADGEGWIEIDTPSDIADGAARVICPPGGERIAIFRDGDHLHALSNVCKHQGGPLGEGRIIDGCVTCPWHGYQYRPGDGQSPPPYTEKVPTYELRVEGDRVLVKREPNAPGTPTPGVVIPNAGTGGAS